jgi:heme exporter protein D
MNWSEFFHMGGYAYYVWPSWGLTALVILWQYLQPKMANKRIRREISRQIAREKKHHSKPA